SNSNNSYSLDKIRRVSDTDSIQNTDFGSEGFYLAELTIEKEFNANSLLAQIRYFQRTFKRIKIVGIGASVPKESENLLKKVEQDASVANDQLSITGLIIDAFTNQPLQYASIGIENSQVGTVSEANGSFTLILSSSYLNDTLSISFVGYEQVRIPILKLIGVNQKIKLVQSSIHLGEVIIHDVSQVKKIHLGSKIRKTNKFGYVQGKGAGAQIARLMNESGDSLYLLSASVYVWNKSKDAVKLILNILDIDSQTGLPGRTLINQPVIIEDKNINKGWLDIEISEYGIIMDQPFYLSIQWVDDKTKDVSIGLGGNNDVLLRTASFSPWIKPENFNWAIKVEASVIN
ncbi:carboxypeptidase-like regulatory domain-containing protein, partial [Fulvivirga sp. RKSG066]|uniref:carboxypeptidase-like regulatory domain-containing protein n=1 Tax=Fulvivirga aurantia TaxID=2529383 RepID=UPI001627583C